MHFLCHDTTLKKILSIKKLNLIWNKQTHFNKLGSLPRVFQIVLTGRGMRNLPGKGGSTGWQESNKKWFWPLELFLKLKTTFCKYWTLIKIKISMTCMSKEYEVKIKMVQEQWLQLKIKFLLGYNMKIII